MELLQLRYFCDAAKTQNFSKTAAKFHIPTSGVSQAVKRLEKELGTPLFEHRANRILLADSGKLLLEKAGAALALLDEATQKITAISGQIGGELRLLVLCNRRAVTAAIERFKAVYPQVNFVLRHEWDENFSADICITDSCPPDYREAGLLVREPILLAMSASHPLATREDLTPAMLRGEHFISMPRGRSMYDITVAICRENGFLPDITIQTDDPYYIRKYIDIGLGIAFVPSYSWEGQFPAHVVLKKIGDYTRNTYVCLPKGQTDKKARGAFLQYLQV